jgi:hypothetical protein
VKIYNVGDIVWYAECGSREVSIQCPVCFGKRQVVVILGNDDQVTTPCSYCSHGYEPPNGRDTEYKFISEPKQYWITSIESKITADGELREYHSGTLTCYRRLENDKIFDTEEEALKKCEEVKAELEYEQTTKAEYLKEKAHKSFSWNAGYHLREAKRYKRQIEYHEKMAVLCKARAKEEKVGE